MKERGEKFRKSRIKRIKFHKKFSRKTIFEEEIIKDDSGVELKLKNQKEN